jgi:tripartite-type tricarboxylate transporter receptor subunit TctC
MNRRHFLRSVTMLGGAVLSGAAYAEYPDRLMRLVVPYTAGGPADIIARLLAQRLSGTLGQSIVIENRPGAGLVAGANYAAHARPDGYTLFVGAASMLIASTPGRTPEQNLHDFAPISQTGSFPEVVIANLDLPVKTTAELIAYGKQNPGKLSYGSSGIGSLTHMAGALFAHQTGIDMMHVPYRGINEALTDVVAARVQLAFPGAPIGLPLARSGQVRALAFTGAQRSASDPDLPTVAESGLPGYDVTPWYGVLAPARTPPEVIAVWHTQITAAMQMPDMKRHLLSLGADNVFSKTPDSFATLMRAETDKWARLVQDAHIQLQ